MEFSHIDKKGNIKQVSVQHKPVVERRAIASGFIHLSPKTIQMISDHSVTKGNVLATARIAGIQAAKKTSDLIPLCHPLLLDHVAINFEMKATGIIVLAEALTSAKTGVEMEVLTAVNVALLTIYDMCKAVDKKMYFDNVHLVQKKKGRT